MCIQGIFSLSSDVYRLSLVLRRASSVFIWVGESVRRFALDMCPASAPNTHRAALLALASRASGMLLSCAVLVAVIIWVCIRL